MNRLALTAALASAVLGSGCIVKTADGTGTVNVYWAFRRAAPAHAGGHVIYDGTYDSSSAAGICTQSDVDTVRVTTTRGYQDVDCTGPVGGGLYVQGLVVDVDSGTNDITVTGYRSGVAVYRSTVAVSVGAGHVVDEYVDVWGIRAPLEVFGDLAYGSPGTLYSSCTGAGSPNLDVELHDSYGTLVDHLASGCGDPLPSIAYNDLLDLDSYTVRLRGYRVSDSALVFDACNQSLNHFATQTGAGGFTATLYTLPVPTCP